MHERLLGMRIVPAEQVEPLDLNRTRCQLNYLPCTRTFVGAYAVCAL
jgi:hypothetical protein